MKPILIVLLTLLSINVLAQNDTVISKPVYKGHPVISLNDTLFYIYLNVGNMSAEERAGRISAKIESVANEGSLIPDSLTLYKSDVTTDIGFKDLVICSAFDAEAAYENITRDQLAELRLQKVKKALIRSEKQFGLKKITYRLISLLVIFTLLFVFIKYSKRWHTKLKERFFRWLDGYLNKRKLLNAGAVYIENQKKIFDALFNGFYYIIIFFLIYASLPFLFRLFPQTKKWGDLLIQFTLQPIQNIISKIIAYIPNAITIVVIYFVFQLIMKLFRFLAKEISESRFSIPGFYPDWAYSTYNIIRFLLYVFFCIVIFPYLPGSDSEAFKGFSVFLGILISIGSSSAISNMLSGLVITYMRPFIIGDRVKIGDTTGDVIEKSLLVTRIKTIKNEIISVPNQFVMSGNTVNYSTMAKQNQLILYTSVTIGYDAPWQTIHKLLINAALETEGIINEPRPFVLQNALNDFYVEYQINAYTNNAQVMANTYSNLHAKIQDKFNEAGVEIMSPHFSSLRDGNAIAIPDENKPKGYQSPAFKVKN